MTPLDKLRDVQGHIEELKRKLDNIPESSSPEVLAAVTIFRDVFAITDQMIARSIEDMLQDDAETLWSFASAEACVGG